LVFRSALSHPPCVRFEGGRFFDTVCSEVHHLIGEALALGRKRVGPGLLDRSLQPGMAISRRGRGPVGGRSRGAGPWGASRPSELSFADLSSDPGTRR